MGCVQGVDHVRPALRGQLSTPPRPWTDVLVFLQAAELPSAPAVYTDTPWSSAKTCVQTGSAEMVVALYRIQDPYETTESPKISPRWGNAFLDRASPLTPSDTKGGGKRLTPQWKSCVTSCSREISTAILHLNTSGHTEWVPEHLYRHTSGLLGSENKPVWVLAQKWQRSRRTARFINWSLPAFNFRVVTIAWGHLLRT